MKAKTLNLAAFTENPDNPQTVTDESFAALVESVRTMPQTLEANKIAFVTDYVSLDGTDYTGKKIVIAGNKRLRALKEIERRGGGIPSADGGFWHMTPNGDVPAAWFFDLTPLGVDARRRWLVKSNIQSGEWDAEKLLVLYSEQELDALMGDDNLKDLLASIDTGADSDYDVAPLDDGEAGATKQDEIVATFGSVKVPMTPKELELITAKYYAYVKEHQVGYGFIKSLLEAS